jgi:hypothetical protein
MVLDEREESKTSRCGELKTATLVTTVPLYGYFSPH